jgi:hypothetical protein
LFGCAELDAAPAPPTAALIVMRKATIATSPKTLRAECLPR